MNFTKTIKTIQTPYQQFLLIKFRLIYILGHLKFCKRVSGQLGLFVGGSALAEGGGGGGGGGGGKYARPIKTINDNEIKFGGVVKDH